MKQTGTNNLDRGFSKKWIYDWLVSCPAILMLGHYSILHREGIVLFPVLNYRVNILSMKGKIRVVSNIPDQLLPCRISEICMKIVKGLINSSDFVTSAMIKTMFYGGFNIFINNDNEAVPVVLDLINTSAYRFFLDTKPVKIMGSPSTKLSSWILFGTALRTGNTELFKDACIELKGTLLKEQCIINTPMGKLLVIPKSSNRINEVNQENYIEIVPDNNPIRHVIKVD